MSDSNLTIDDLNALPEKMRAHAAAKAVGMARATLYRKLKAYGLLSQE